MSIDVSGMAHFAPVEEDVPTPRVAEVRELTEAATKIQAMWRGKQIRKQELIPANLVHMHQTGDDVVIKVKKEQSTAPDSTEGSMTCALWIYLCLALAVTALGAGLFMFAWRFSDQGMFAAQPAQQAQVAAAPGPVAESAPKEESESESSDYDIDYDDSFDSYQEDASEDWATSDSFEVSEDSFQDELIERIAWKKDSSKGEKASETKKSGAKKKKSCFKCF